MNAHQRLRAEMDKDRGASVNILLDTRPDLTPKQRARLHQIGLEQGVAKVRRDLVDLIPPPRAKRTEEPAKGGFRPSGNPEMMQKMRISADPADAVVAPGCRLHSAAEREATGKLMTMSIWDALPSIMQAMAKRADR